MAITLFLFACQPKLTSPPPAPDAADPPIVCNDQLTTVVTVSGDGFTPLPSDVLTDAKKLLLPDVWVELVTAVDGSNSDGATVELGPAMRWLSTSELELTLSPDLAMPQGVYDLYVKNADDQVSGAGSALMMVDPPATGSLVPDLVCLEQGDVATTLSGVGLLEVDGVLPTVTFGDLPITPDSLEQCVDLVDPATGRRCEVAELTLPENGLDVGIYPIAVTNPETAECTSTEVLDVEVVPAPILESVTPDPTCVDQGDEAYVLTGQHFLVLADGTTPTVSMGKYTALADEASDCAPLAGPAGGELCSTLAFVLPEDAEGPGVLDVVVTNPAPADCQSTEPLQIEVVPRPTVTGFDPDPTCIDQEDRTYVVSGTDFLVLADGTVPAVSVGTYTADANYADGCKPLAGPAGGERCTTLGFTLPIAAEVPGVHDVVVTNPAPAECFSEETVLMEIVPKPQLTDIEPGLTCVDQGGRSYVLTGQDFFVDDTILPTVFIGAYSERADYADGCTKLAGPAGGLSCTELGFTLPEDGEEPGIHNIYVENPDPAGCITEEAVEIEVVDTPVLDTIAPDLSCTEQADRDYVLSGGAFVVLDDGTLPTVTVNATTEDAQYADDCADLTGPDGGEICDTLGFTLPQGAEAPGIHLISVNNPYPADCSTEEVVELELVPEPLLVSATPQLSCADDRDVAFTLIGSDFIVLEDGTTPEVTVGSTGPLASVASECASLLGPAGGQACTRLDVVLPEGTANSGVQRVTVFNPSPANCSSEDSINVELVPEPVVASIVEDLVCNEQANTFTVSGGGFIGLDDGSLPTIHIGSWSAEAETISDCLALGGPAGGQSCATLTVTPPADALAASVLDVRVVNPGDTACDSNEAVQVETIVAPSLTSTDPMATCLDDGDEGVTFSGTGFLVLADGTTPTVHVDGISVMADSADDCVPLSGPAGGEVCQTLVATLPEDALTGGAYGVQIENPSPADCVTPEAIDLEVWDSPTVASLDETLSCNEQFDTTLTLTGTGFLVDDGVLPTVDFVLFSVVADSVSGCTTPADSAMESVCTELVVTVPEDALVQGLYPVSVTNPGSVDCFSKEVHEIEVVGAPSMASLTPPDVCYLGADTVIQVDGTEFLDVDGELPTVTIDSVDYPATSVSGCTDLATTTGQRCTGLEFTVPAGAFVDASLHTTTVTNPSPVACVSGTEDFASTDPPTLTSIDPTSVCDDGATISLQGLGFNPGATVDVGGVAAVSVDVVDTTEATAVLPAAMGAGTYDVTFSNIDTCGDTLTSALTVLDLPSVDGVVEELVCGEQTASTFTITGTGFVDVGGTLPVVAIGSYAAEADSAAGCVSIGGGEQVCTELSLTVAANTLPAGVHEVSVVNPSPYDCGSATTQTVEVVGRPVLASIAPDPVCWETDNTMTLSGSGFLTLGSDLPTVIIGGTGFTPTSAGGCTALTGPVSGRLCTSLVVDIPSDTFTSPGDRDIIVTNPSTGDCSTEEAVALTFENPPTIVSAAPDPLCDTGETFTVTGTDFKSDARVFVQDTGGLETEGDVVYVDSTTLTVSLPDAIGPGLYDVIVRHDDGCSDELADGLELVPLPIVFFADPPTVYNGLSIRGTIYVTDINGGITRVWLERTDDLGVEIDLTDFAYDPGVDEGKLYATIPDGLAEGDYNVWLEDEALCQPTLSSGIFAEADLTVAIDRVDPPFAWTDDFTPVEIYATDPVTGDEVQFENVPRVYLSASADADATELFGITFQNATQLDSIVPDGLTVGTYDVLVVNPDGQVGVLDDGFSVVVDAPPVITSISPATFPSNADVATTIIGSDFRNPAVDLDCTDPNTGSQFTVSITPTDSDATTIDLTMPSSSSPLSAGAVCVVTVTNSDSTYNNFAAISVTSPSQNLYDWQAGAELITARRAPASTAARATRSARYVYAIGGDDGAEANAFTSIEAANVNNFGDLGDWFELPMSLDSARTLAGITTIGRFVYLIGGHDGSTPVDTALRAQVLDPLSAPRIIDVDIDYGSGVELEEGTWVYRVAALYPASYDVNPGGESLASDPFVIRLPDIEPDKVTVTLTWTEDADANGYRIYRSPTADLGSGYEEWLTDVVGGTTTSWTDDNTETPAGIEPLPQGSLGEWYALPGLDSPRQSPCVTSVFDPSDPTLAYVYVGGGLDELGGVLDDIEILEVDVLSDTVQAESGTWFTSTNTLPTARYECAAFPVEEGLHSVVSSGEAYVYFGGGRTSSSTTGDTDVGQFSTGGELTGWQGVDSFTPRRAGYGYASASNFLYAFGGQNGSPHAGGASTEIDGPPSLDGWNSLGLSMSDDRYLMGSAQESSVIFVIGGDDGTGPLSTVDWTNY